MPAKLDLDLQPDQIAKLTSPEAVAGLFHTLGYPTGKRRTLSPAGLGLGDTEKSITRAEVISEDEDGFLRVVFVRLKAVTAKARGELVRAFGRDAIADHLLILTNDFESLEFVLIEKEQRTKKVGVGQVATVARGRVFVVPRRWPEQMMRVLRRLTYTMDDGLRQYDKLKSVFDAAHFSGTYFTNRALFADHFLEKRLKDDPTWKVEPGPSFQSVRRLIDIAPDRIANKPLMEAKQELFDPLWTILGFTASAAAARTPDRIEPDYRLNDPSGAARTVVLTYPWLRWLDGPDPNDPDRSAENPGAAVVTLLERGDAEWAIVTNGKLWRLYSRTAHSRSTNFYEVDLQDALISSGLSDPNEAFRYWWLFFRLEAFAPVTADGKAVWLDTVAEGSRDYAREVEIELKRRVFYDVVPMLASGFIHDRRTRLKQTAKPDEAELEEIRAGTLTLLYRILFLLYAESRDLLPVREAAYYEISLKRLKEEVRSVAGVSQSEADGKIDAKYSKLQTDLYDRLGNPKTGLFAAMSSGRSAANVPKYNGGLFRLDPTEAADEREAEVAKFLNTHRVPDAFLAAAIDRLARVEDPHTYSLEFVDYKSLGVRQLGSIYEGLLEFRLGFADEDLTVKENRSGSGALGEYIPLGKARGKSSKKAVRQIKKGDAILQRDKTERKATGSYYTPDHIVQYIVENTVGPVLKRKTEALRPAFRKAEQTFHRCMENAKADPRIMLGHASAAALRTRRVAEPAAKPTAADFRAFALAQTYDQHKDLVEQLFDLKVLDPSMGSGHFLVEAVDFITDEFLDFLNAFPNNPVSAALDRTREAILESLREQGIEVDEFLRRQLTDVHLLKRHVLKRCIYGVDLNPLATELAKVSLWLDAFTLGAPLSFLDHHLRTGNSLIGASLPELESEIHDSLFKIDESHLLRAVQNVLAVARLSDATASEVAESKRAFDDARKTLSGYAVLLDILVARHFGHAAATSILSMGQDLKLESREAFFKSLRKLDRELVTDVTVLAKDRRFFHWDLEFPEVFYTVAGLADGRIERRTGGNAGFDAIVGNPPWGDAQLDSSHKRMVRLQRVAADIAEAFVFSALSLGRREGRIGLIVPDTLLGASKAAVRRAMLTEGRTEGLFNIGPDWFGSQVRMSGLIWLCIGRQELDFAFASCTFDLELRTRCQAGRVTLATAIAACSRQVSSTECLGHEYARIPLFGLDETVVGLTGLRSGPTLSTICDHGRGVELNREGLVVQCVNCDRWNAPPAPPSDGRPAVKLCAACGEEFEITARVRSRYLVSAGERPVGAVPYIIGEDISRYGTPRPLWLDIGAEGINFKDPSLYTSPKLLVRQAGLGINLFLDEGESAYCPQSVYVYRLTQNAVRAGWSERVLASLLSTRLFLYQVFTEFGEIDNSRAFPKLTHSRLGQLRVPDVAQLHNFEGVSRIVDEEYAAAMSAEQGSRQTADWRIEGAWSRAFRLTQSDVRAIVHLLARVHHNVLLEQLFPGGLASNESHWSSVWWQTMSETD